MLEIASRITPQAFYKSLLIFTQKAMHDDILHVLAILYYMLSGDAAMSTVAPFDSHELLQLCYDCALVGQPSEKDLQELKTYCVELVQLIMFGITHKCQKFVKDFCQCLVGEIKECMRIIGLLQQSTLCLIVTTPQVVQHITSHHLVCSCTNYLDMKSAQMTKKRIPTLMISQRWTKHAGRCSPACPEVALDIFFVVLPSTWA